MKITFHSMLSFQFTGMSQGHFVEVERIKGDMRAPSGVFCSLDFEDFFRANEYTSEDIYRYCVEMQSRCKSVLFVIRNGPESRGMKLELDRAIELGQGIALNISKDIREVPWIQPFLEAAGDNLTVV